MTALPRARVGFVWVALATGCIYEPPVMPKPAGAKTTLTLSADLGGLLRYCDERGTCQNLANPDQCATLVIVVDQSTAATCETCTRKDGTVLYERCGDTQVACALITAPEPDCVVCAYSGGSVIFSTCVPQQPDNCVVVYPGDPKTADPNASPVSGEPALGGECRICYDDGGNVVLDECGAACTQVICPLLACASGYQAVRRPGECCDVCLPSTWCAEVACPQAMPVPWCPPDTILVRDPADCCRYLCEPVACPPSRSSDPTSGALLCPPGYVSDPSYPSCGSCVPADASAYCCEAWIMPAAEACQGGKWQSPGADACGCPLPPVCLCPDSSVAVNGVCVDACAGVYCPQLLQCDSGTHLETRYPYCCGVCVPDSTCPADACGNVFCEPGSHCESTPDCTAGCVPDLGGCYVREDCGAGEYCTTETGDCRMPPDCVAGTTCPGKCYGVCQTIETNAP